MLFNLVEYLRDWLTRNDLYRWVMIIDQREFRVLAAALLSFAIVLVFGKRVIRWLTSKKIGDQAKFDVKALEDANAGKANTPTMGGLLIAAAIGVSTLLLADMRNTYVQLALIVLVWLAAVGGADDWLKLTASSRGSNSRQGLYAWEKLVFQVGIGLLAGYFAYRAGFTVNADKSLAHVVNLPFQKTYANSLSGPNPSLLYWEIGGYTILMLLMMTGMSNAVNITDGMDGLAGGVSAVVAFGLTILCLIAGSEDLAKFLLVPYVSTAQELAVVTGALAGACLGFLWWNCSPASVFMGDTGSLCLGGLLGYIAVVIRQDFVLLVMSAVFVIEIASVMIQVSYFKWTKGKRVFRCAPYHWHLRMGGWPEQRIVARFWIMSVIAVAVGLATLKLR
ncbi:MAG: phospho-N-acetylmuramoyl-pentapeptide-transferase [Planctomycetes bacterium]|nr:phospho-N-acetylmuramoyl-pentapeptide-transferase [Planctomycetota bacterium]